MSGFERRIRSVKGWSVRSPKDFFGPSSVQVALLDTGFEIKVEDNGCVGFSLGASPPPAILLPGTITLIDEGVQFFLGTMFGLQGSLSQPGGVEFMNSMGFITDVPPTSGAPAPVAAVSDTLKVHPGWDEHPTLSDDASQTSPPPVTREKGVAPIEPAIDPTNLIITTGWVQGTTRMRTSSGPPGVQEDVRGVFLATNPTHFSSTPDKLGWVYIFDNPINQDVFTPDDLNISIIFKITLTIKP